MAKVIGIAYVGKKESRNDALNGVSVTGNNLVWRDGVVHEVSEAHAKILIAHPDIWEAVSERDDSEPTQKATTPTLKAKEDEEIFANVNLPLMTKAQLVNYAHRSFGVKLDGDEKKEALIDKVANLQKQHTQADR